LLYKIQALKNGQCGVRRYITFGDEWDETPHTYFLYIWLVTGGEKPILVDTGPKDVEGFNKATEEYIPIGVTQSADETTVGALEKAGIDPADVGWVFITHMHGDHYSNHDLFPNATVVVSEKGFPNGPESAPADVRNRLMLVGDEEVLPGIRTFHLGCHSEDSQGIAIDTAKGRVVLSGDVAYMFENIECDRPIRAQDIDACCEALRKLRSQGDIILPGHDPLILERYPGGIVA
jgi:glyoxylase-like metal-dependent hydrolase (beta-lactamase superfamily II)